MQRSVDIASHCRLTTVPPSAAHTQIIRDTADKFVDLGLRDAGYEYINIDDCWQVSRDAHNVIQSDPKSFPSGMKALADYVHARGLKFGLYSDAGDKSTLVSCFFV